MQARGAVRDRRSRGGLAGRRGAVARFAEGTDPVEGGSSLCRRAAEAGHRDLVLPGRRVLARQRGIGNLVGGRSLHADLRVGDVRGFVDQNLDTDRARRCRRRRWSNGRGSTWRSCLRFARNSPEDDRENGADPN